MQRVNIESEFMRLAQTYVPSGNMLYLGEGAPRNLDLVNSRYKGIKIIASDHGNNASMIFEFDHPALKDRLSVVYGDTASALQELRDNRYDAIFCNYDFFQKLGEVGLARLVENMKDSTKPRGINCIVTPARNSEVNFERELNRLYSEDWSIIKTMPNLEKIRNGYKIEYGMIAQNPHLED